MRFDNELKFSTIVKAATAAVGVEVPTSLHQVSSNKYKTTTRPFICSMRSHWASSSQDAEAYNASSRRKALVARTQVSLFRAPKPPFKMCLKPGGYKDNPPPSPK